MARGGLGSARIAVAAVTLAVLAASCGTVTVPGGAAPRASSARKAAQAYAMRLLAKLQLPAGAQHTAWPRGENRLLKPQLPVYLGDFVEARVLYRLPVGKFLTGRVPPGMQPGDGGGQATLRGTTVAQYANYMPRRLPPGIFSAALATATIPSGSGSLVSVAAQVVWYPPRSAAEYIHAGGYRSVTATVPSGSGGSTMTRTFTSPAVVAELASLLNRLPASVPFVESCPAAAVAPYSVIFTPRSARWPRIVVTPSGCFVDGIRVGGHTQPALQGGNALISALHRLPGLHAAGA
jgi:hypothetical protein